MNLNDTHDVSYLRDLLEDFSTPQSPAAEEAWLLIEKRSLQLEKQSGRMISLHRVRNFQKAFLKLAHSLHGYLYADILSNAGEFRKSADPNGGFVGFGGDDQRRPGHLRFAGSMPANITKDLNESFSFLTKKDARPVRNAVAFYRSFVKIHPFYDANGRIGRIIVSIYLAYHGYYVFWEDLLEGGKRTQFYKKLNECHKREGQRDYEKYFDLLTKYFEKFTETSDHLLQLYDPG